MILKRKILLSILIVILLMGTLIFCKTLRYRGYYESCHKLSKIKNALNSYKELNGHYPIAIDWSDKLTKSSTLVKDIFGNNTLTDSFKKNWMNFTINSTAIDAKQPLPDDMVLIFNSDYGWNQVGGRESVVTTYLPKKNGILVLFVSGEIRFVKAQDIDSLKWDFADAESDKGQDDIKSDLSLLRKFCNIPDEVIGFKWQVNEYGNDWSLIAELVFKDSESEAVDSYLKEIKLEKSFYYNGLLPRWVSDLELFTDDATGKSEYIGSQVLYKPDYFAKTPLLNGFVVRVSDTKILLYLFTM